MTSALEEFKKICQVPRRSFHNDKIIAYCIQRAEELGLFCYYDREYQNVLIRKPAVPGKEDHPGVVLQGHLDMVPQTDEGVRHDWENEGLELIEDGDILTANGTTLGADDGVAPAIAFALLTDESLQNPPLEVLLTTDEEVGMKSVREADLSYIEGTYLFNLDCGGEEGVFVNGCSGGVSLCVRVSMKKEEAEGNVYTISVSGLKGGHSGTEIGMERGNALKLLGEVFHDIEKQYEFRIVDLIAEGKDNAISRAVSAEIVILSRHTAEEIETLVKNTETRMRTMYRRTEPDLSIQIKDQGSRRVEAFSEKEMTFLLYQLPFGVLNRDQNLDGEIETSCNLGMIEKDNDSLGICVSIRSSVEERKQLVSDHIRSLAEIVGAEVEIVDKSYPGWIPDPDSPLIKIFSDMYRKMYGKEAVIGPVHAGLECGYILKNSGLKAALAFGPKMWGEHTTQESLSISSLERTLEFVKAVVESI